MVNNTIKQTIRILLVFTIITSLIFASQVSAVAVKNTTKTSISGICGSISIGPVTPVSKINVKNEKPYRATVIVYDKKTLKKITQFSSNNAGYLRIFIKPGTYILKPIQGAVYPKSNSIVVEVKKDKLSYVFIKYDSGIR